MRSRSRKSNASRGMSTLVFTLEPRCIDTRERIPYERIEVERPQCQPAMTVDGAMVSRPLLIGFLGNGCATWVCRDFNQGSWVTLHSKSPFHHSSPATNSLQESRSERVGSS